MKAKINGFDMAYDVIGQSGHPMVLIHGFGLSRSIWYQMVKKSLGDVQVILPDVRGHGESQAPEGAYPMALLAEDILNLLDRLNIKKAAICGHSMGGYIALAFAKNYPERLSGLGLITTRAESDTEEKRAGRYDMVVDVKSEGAVVLAESLALKLSKDKAIQEEAYRILSQTNPKGIIGALQGMAARPDSTSLLKKITVPALVAAGREDQIVPVEEAQSMAEALPGAEFLLLESAGHMPMLESPGALGEGLSRLISRIDKAGHKPLDVAV